MGACTPRLVAFIAPLENVAGAENFLALSEEDDDDEESRAFREGQAGDGPTGDSLPAARGLTASARALGRKLVLGGVREGVGELLRLSDADYRP